MRETKRITEFPKSGEAARVDARLRTVMVELFLPNFIGATNARQAGTWSEFARNTLTLFASATCLGMRLRPRPTTWRAGGRPFKSGRAGRANDLELIFLLGPSHGYADYFPYRRSCALPWQATT